MSPIFKCLICRRDIERSTKTFWIKKGHLLCSTCLDNIDTNKKYYRMNINKNKRYLLTPLESAKKFVKLI